MQHLIVPGEISLLSRTISKHIDSSRVELYIAEAENIEIKQALGDELFIDVINHPELYTTLLDGGEYEIGKKKKHIAGLRTALAYFAYSRIVKNIDGNATRFGYVNKENEYSRKAERKDYISESNDAYDIANLYLKECVRYCQDTNVKLYCGNGGIKSNRIIHRIIGE